MSDHSLLFESPPRGWVPACLNDVCIRVKDTALPSAGGERFYIGLEHLASGFPVLVGRGKESEVRSGKTAFRKGDVLFGKLRPYLRKSVLVDDAGICSTDILVLRATERCIPELLCLLTHTDEFIGHAKATTSGVQHPRTSWTALREFKFFVPPLPEQQNIAGVLGIVRQAIEQQERLTVLTTELKKMLLHQLFTHGLRGEPQKQTEIGPVPESWELVELGSIATKVSKGSSPRWQGFEYVSNGVMFVRSQNVGVGRVDFSDRVYLPDSFNKKEKRSILKNEDILINLVGASIGRVALGTPEIEGANCNQAVCFVRIDRPRSLKEFIVFYLLSPVGQQQMFFQKKDMARANLSLLDVRTFKLPLPKADEVCKIAEALTTIERKLEAYEKKRSVLFELFRTLLYQLMTAQIRVHNLDLTELEITQ